MYAYIKWCLCNIINIYYISQAKKTPCFLVFIYLPYDFKMVINKIIYNTLNKVTEAQNFFFYSLDILISLSSVWFKQKEPYLFMIILHDLFTIIFIIYFKNISMTVDAALWN